MSHLGYAGANAASEHYIAMKQACAAQDSQAYPCDVKVTELDGVCNRFAAAIQHIEMSCERLERVDTKLNGGKNTAQSAGNQPPSPVPNGVIQAMSMGVDRLMAHIGRLDEIISRLNSSV